MLDRFRTAPDRVLAALLVVWTGLVMAGAYRCSLAEVAWPDECIYLAGARNVAERGTLNTQFYLAHSLILRGYPHRDVHMPGYILALAPFVRGLGMSIRAAIALNALSLIGSTLLLFAIARKMTGSAGVAFAASALFPLMPPFPGYLTVAYPELVVTFVFLAGLAWLVRVDGAGEGGSGHHAVVAGVLFALGGLFRETLWLAFPLYALALPQARLWRRFLPAALVTFLVVIMPLGRHRAIHPNALYPGVLMEARRAPEPVRYVVDVLVRNVSTNVRLAFEAAPGSRVEDAVLAFLAALVVLSFLAWRSLPASSRVWLKGLWLSLGALTAAVFVLYVVRERGGVWGGVRAYMTWAPILLVMAVAALARVRVPWRGAALVLAVGVFLFLDQWQLYWFGRYKASDLEDQERNAAYLARYIEADHPRRIVSRSFVYGFRHYPMEVVWGVPWDIAELEALEKVVDFEYLSIHEKHPLRLYLIQNPRYLRVNKDDKGAEFLIWRRLY
jgi:hypothetical protein